MTRPQWGSLWEPGRAAPAVPPRRLSFGGDDTPPEVSRLDGGYVPAFPVDMDRAPAAGAPRVLIEEPVAGWWTQAGRFGFKFQDLVPAEGEIIGLTESIALPGPPKPLWLNWFRYNRGLSTEFDPSQNFELRGRVIYGVGGAQNTIEVDLISGVQFPVVCNSVTVQFVTYNPYAPNVGAAYAAGEVACGVMFGQGSGGGALPPTWSSPIFESDGSGQFIDNQYVIPDFARSMAVHVSTITPAELAKISVAFLDAGGALISSVSMDPALGGYALLSQEKGVPIPTGSNSALLLGAPATLPPGTRAQMKFFLAL
jgi:hypothetical protein